MSEEALRMEFEREKKEKALRAEFEAAKAAELAAGVEQRAGGVPAPAEPGGSAGTGKPIKQRGRGYNLAKAEEERRYQEELKKRGQAAQARAAYAKKLGVLPRMGVGMVEEGRKLLSVGPQQAYNFMDWMYQSAMGDKEGAMDALNRKAALEESERLRAIEMKEMEENLGVPGFFGASVPYIATSITGAPAASAVAGAGLRGVSAAGKQAKKTVGGALGTGIERMAQKGGLIGSAGQRLKRETLDPLRRRAARIAQREKIRDPHFEGAAQRVGGDILLGMAEGAIHPDISITEGGLASGAGSLTGNILKPMLSKAPVYWEKAERDLIDWGKDQGMRFSPGMETGSNALSMFEAGLRGEKSWTDAMKAFDQSNDRIINRVTQRTMGLTDAAGDQFTPETLQRHMRSLKNEYNDLENASIGRFESTDMAQMRQAHKELKKSRLGSNRDAAKKLKEHLDEFQRHFKPVRGKRGTFQKATFDGGKYQTMRRSLKEDLDKAYDNGDKAMIGALKPMLEKLDNAMLNGIEDFGGTASAAQWKDLNERFAMSKLVMNHGMKPTGGIDLDRMTNHLMSNDPERLLMDQGGRIRDIFKLVKLRSMSRSRPGDVHRTAGISNPERVSKLHAFLDTPARHMLLGADRAYMGLYRRGYPSVTGLLGMQHQGLWNAPLLTRAAAQGSQFHPNLFDYMAGAGESLSNAASTAQSGLVDLKELLMGRDE